MEKRCDMMENTSDFHGDSMEFLAKVPRTPGIS